jgi:acetylornithine/succinyldiaminopimelate/putrescine aminotransferase
MSALLSDGSTVHQIGQVKFTSKADVIEKAEEFWNPGKTRFWSDSGIDLVIDRREGYFLYDMNGKRLIDVHLNGGTYNLGHRNAELIKTIEDGMDRMDIGNHHFPSMARTALAEELVATCHDGMSKVIYGAGGAEAVDIALKTARHTTGRRKIVSVVKAYHGHTGLAVGTGDERFSKIFLSDRPDEFQHVPFNDADAMETALAERDVAAVIMETIPATYGFPQPQPGYLEQVAKLCEEYGTLYIADEVQTGLMRSGEMWAIDKHGIRPDIMVIGKGISGGMYPLSGVVVTEECSAWLHEDGFAHMSTMGGAELGCLVGLKVLEICQRPEVRSMVHYATSFLGDGLRRIQALYPDFFVGIRQNGLIMGLEFDHPQGGTHVMEALYRNGVWAIFATLDRRVLQFKPGLLVSPQLCDEILDRLEVSIAQARAVVTSLEGARP